MTKESILVKKALEDIWKNRSCLCPNHIVRWTTKAVSGYLVAIPKGPTIGYDKGRRVNNKAGATLNGIKRTWEYSTEGIKDGKSNRDVYEDA